MALYQAVFFAHHRVGHLFGWIELIFNDFKDGAETGQHKHRHHHATHAWGDNEVIFTLGYLMIKRPKKRGFTMLEKTD